MIKKIKLPELYDAPFLVVPKPFKDELLSSWLIRTAYAHHTHPHTFVQLHLNKKGSSLFSTDMDVIIQNVDIERITKKSLYKINLNELTLKIYNGYLQENIISNGLNKMLCHLRFCPKCLQENIPYYKKEWRITFNTICSKNLYYLKDSCPKCHKKIKISRMYQQKMSFKYCSSCGFDLSKSRITNLDKNAKTYYPYTKELMVILQNGYIQFSNKIVYSFIFFDAIVQLCKKILKHKQYKFVNKNSLFKYLKTKKQYKNSSPIHMQITIQEQFILFSIVMKLFENYPRNIIRYIHDNKLSHWQMVKDLDYVSFWYENLVNDITPTFIPITKLITNEEIKNGKIYLKSKKLLVNKANLTRLFGCNFFSIYNNLASR